jgi:hypothetical protein
MRLLDTVASFFDLEAAENHVAAPSTALLRRQPTAFGTSPPSPTSSDWHHIPPRLHLHIAKMPDIATLDFAAEISEAVRQLKVERDTWQAVALQYKAAFEAQTSRLQEFRDVCFAAQAELENERAQHRQLHALSDVGQYDYLNTMDGAEDVKDPRTFGTATVFPRDGGSRPRRVSEDCNNPLYHRVQEYIEQSEFGTAKVEVERLLRGPLSPKARAEGLLLKSTILRAAGPDQLYDALASCSEALELCDRLSDLESFLPKVQYQRGLLYYQLRMLHQARDAFSTIGDDDVLYATANKYRHSCDDEIRRQRSANRRSGFEESRVFSEDLVVCMDEKLDVS